IDFSKIESRPTSAQLLQYLRFQQSAMGNGNSNGQGGGENGNGDLPRFQYCFYLASDFLAGELDDAAQSAMAHLRELTPFARLLGSYPRKSKLVGPVCDTLEVLARQQVGGV
ncbi:unnamed protein product, partial [Discosporangium mesarthrocarpum]